jgi:hypothetical protein
VTGTASVTIGTNSDAIGPVVVAGAVLRPRRAPPAEYLLGTNLPSPSHLRYARARSQSLCNDPRLVLRGPAAATAGTGQDLNPPKPTLRVILNVKHNDSSKPSASGESTISGPAVKQGRQSSAYG